MAASQDGVPLQLWAIVVAAIGIALGFVVSIFRTSKADQKANAELLERVGVLENKASAAEKAIERSQDAIGALADSNRVLWEKTQQQIWDMRNDLAKLPTANQLYASEAKIIEAIHGSRAEGK